MKMMNPKLAQATKKPLAAQRIKNAAPAGRPNSGIGMIGGPKASIPTPVNPSPARPPLKAAPATGGSFYNSMMGRQNPTPSPGVPNSGIGMIGGPKASIPTPVNPSPARPPLKAAPAASEAHKGLKAGGAAKPKAKMMAGGGMAKMMSSGGSASKRADGIAARGKTRG